SMAVNLLNNRFEIEAYIILLATWNIGTFRFALKNFEINGFKEKIKKVSPYFNKMEGERFQTINFDEYKEDIKKIFKTLSQIGVVKYTGASKLMHLKNRDVFIMWDDYIRGGKAQKYYDKLRIVKNGFWKFKRYEKDAESYFQFLKDMQDRFKNINFSHPKKTFAKAIDEFNYVNITLHIQSMENEKKRRK
ncbi:MAG: hypothetical protein KKA79_09785, partial [Nanoarchaeota archaeon]|nr:hypothetical protein [Nanoarchaeota archaeon]